MAPHAGFQYVEKLKTKTAEMKFMNVKIMRETEWSLYINERQ